MEYISVFTLLTIKLSLNYIPKSDIHTFSKVKTVSINEELVTFCIIGNHHAYEYHSTLNKRLYSNKSIKQLDAIKFDDSFF